MRRILFLGIAALLPTTAIVVGALLTIGSPLHVAVEFVLAQSGILFLTAMMWSMWIVVINEGLNSAGMRKIPSIGVELKEIPAHNGMEGDYSQPQTSAQKIRFCILFILICTAMIFVVIYRNLIGLQN